MVGIRASEEHRAGDSVKLITGCHSDRLAMGSGESKIRVVVRMAPGGERSRASNSGSDASGSGVTHGVSITGSVGHV